jgi:hypothetical protein
MTLLLRTIRDELILVLIPGGLDGDVFAVFLEEALQMGKLVG